MAINTITFGGVNSADYGIYISGEGVFNAPLRDAKMFSIPGRNGSFLLDNGRYENIEVTYRAFNSTSGKATFIAQVDAFRNAIASQKGYQRLEDTFHTDEYRMASFIGGLEINPVLYNDHTSEFDIVFNCKPQRFLKSGETAVSKANNSTITNPTLFNSHPLLQFRSSGTNGTINLGDTSISVLSSYLGLVDLNLRIYRDPHSSRNITLTIRNTSVYNTGDTITISGVIGTYDVSPTHPQYQDYTQSYENVNGFNVSTNVPEGGHVEYELRATDTTFTAGTSSTVVRSVDFVAKNGTTTVGTGYLKLTMAYNGTDTFTLTWSDDVTQYFRAYFNDNPFAYSGKVNSTKNTLQDVDIYIDLDIGEAYSIDASDNVVSLNNFVNIGGNLPVLPPGNTTITYTSGITNFKITPRWWKI